MATRICIDVDLTVVNANEDLLPGVREGLHALKNKGFELTLWSYCGAERARAMARKHDLGCYFDAYAAKPDLVIDDEAEKISRLPAVDAVSMLEKNNPVYGATYRELGWCGDVG